MRDTSAGTGWSRWVSTELSINPPPPSGPPERIEADGDSRTLSSNEGQSEVEWRRVENASSYEVRYCCTEGESSDWSEPLSTGHRRMHILGLVTEVLYQIQVRAVNVSGKSGWSETIYTYPTRTPVAKDETVGIVPVLGFLPSSRYRFTICDIAGSSSSSISDSWETQVEEGMETWEDATGRMVRVNHNPDGKCNNDKTNTVERLDSDTMAKEMWCKRPGLAGCAIISEVSTESGTTHVRVALLSTLAETHRTPTGERDRKDVYETVPSGYARSGSRSGPR